MKNIAQALTGVVLSALVTVFSARAIEPTWNYAVQVSATVQESPARITLTWPQDTTATPGSYTVYRKAAGSTSWGGGTSLPGNSTSYTDNSVSVGTPYEYQIVKSASGYTGYGYIYAGINVPAVDSRGKVILVVDNTIAGSLASELARLEQDLIGDGWTVLRRDVSRTDTPANVKNVIRAAYNSDPANVRSVFLFGHVPVPYSGNIVPDGHYPEHQGAWPADGYYGDMDGNWTDTSVYNTGAENARNRNIPGDGKFDQSELPSAVELEVGRVDLANMPGRKVWGGPATFPSEIELLRNYLNKDHNFRHKRINPPARSVIHDSFGVRGGESFSASGYRSHSAIVGAGQVLTLHNKGEWIPYLRDNPCLLAYGAGAGSYTSIGGLGNTPQYNDGTTTEMYENDVKAVFTMLFGSWLGDWDADDNIMRGVLAWRSMGLSCSWAGRPHWYYHHLGLGETLGYSARLTMNNPNGGLYRNQINSAARNIHIGLMGDPTLRVHAVAPPSNLTSSSGTLRWNPSSDSVVGYHVYRASSASGPFTRITSSPVTGTTYTDGASGTYVYMVKAVKLQTSGSGTYYNTSQGISTSGSGSGNGGDATMPTVSITAPAANATVTGTAVTISASASDNVGVVGVQFKLDGSNLGPEDTTSPYSVSWNTTATPNGVHSLTSVARDAAGNQKVSTPVSVTINNVTTPPPTNAPPTNSPPPNGIPVVTVVATDSTAVEGFTDPATFTFTRSGSLSAALTVHFGLEGTATKWNDYRRRVEGDMPASVVIPAGAASTTLTVHAWPDTQTEGTESFTLTLNNNAAYTVGTPSAAVVNISDTGGSTPPPAGDTTAPTITMTAPTGGSIGIGAQVNVSANAADNVGVVGVQFRLDGVNLGAEDTSSPYSTTWNTTGASAGAHQLSAVARDAAGNRTTSALISLSLTNSGGGTTPPPTNSPPPNGIPVVTVAATDNTAVEGNTDTATFTFTRSGNLSGALAVHFGLAGSATKWNDYRRLPEGDMPVSVTIPAGSASTTLRVHAWSDGTTEGPESFTLTLNNNAAYTVGSPKSAIVTIYDAGVVPPPTGGGVTNNPPPQGTNVVVTNPPPVIPPGTNVVVTNLPPVVPPGTNLPGTVVGITDNTALQMPKVGDYALRIISPTVLELQLVSRKDPDPAPPSPWNFVNASSQLNAPAPGEFNVTANGAGVAVQSVAFKRRPLYAPIKTRDLRLDNCLYLQLASPIAEGATVQVRNPSGNVFNSAMQFTNVASPLRYSPAIHVNQEGYMPNFPKQAMVGYYLGSGGELTIPTGGGFKIVDAATGAQVFQGSLVNRPDVGYPGTPVPYQKVYEADFTGFNTPGEYRLVVPGLGASLPFLIDNGIAMSFTRAYALGLYHQRCGSSNALPFTRHDHGACHTAEADVPLPASSFQFTWSKIAQMSADYANNPRHTAPQLKDEASQLYPIVNRGKIDISRGHHDAGDYSKYTINSAGLVHHLMFAVDSLQGVAALDNLGLPESGDGISDVMQLAKWEADYLSKIQDADGGFYFLIYPRDRAYEGDVTPDRGDPQVVFPKTTAATAAAVAALAQTASSPRFRQAYPAEAAAYLAKAKLGWQFLINAINRYGKDGSYQKITHYGNNFMHDDELAWAATELFVATGEKQYHDKVKEWYDPASPATLHWGWWRLYEAYGCAARSYAFAARSGRLSAGQLDSAYLAKCEQQIVLAAQDHVANSRDNAYGSSFPAPTKRVFSAGWYFSTERAFDIAVGYQIDPRAEFLKAFIANMNFEGGCNPVNVAYVTGLGWKRQREIVHQYSHNDRRVLPPSGIPQGNIVSHFSYIDIYKTELNNVCFPPNDGANRSAIYDRWSDVHNVTAEFVNVDQARGLAGLAFLATLTPAKSTPWKSAAGRIVVPSETSVGSTVTATLQVPGMDLNGARIVWEARDNEPAYGSTTHTFSPRNFGDQWVEAEAQWPDGRRVFAAAQLYATNHLPIINVTTTAANASEAGPVPGSFTFTRTGDSSSALTVNIRFTGTATRWDDYRRPQGDIPETVTFPAGASSVVLTIVPVVDTKVESTETVVVTLQPNAAYNLGRSITATLSISETAVKISSISRSPATGDVTLTWLSQVGKVYQVNSKDNLQDAGWRTLQSGINATGSTTSYVDRTAAAAPKRFYAVLTSA